MIFIVLGASALLVVLYLMRETPGDPSRKGPPPSALHDPVGYEGWWAARRGEDAFARQFLTGCMFWVVVAAILLMFMVGAGACPA